jgi:hypothetical protein
MADSTNAVESTPECDADAKLRRENPSGYFCPSVPVVSDVVETNVADSPIVDDSPQTAPDDDMIDDAEAQEASENGSGADKRVDEVVIFKPSVVGDKLLASILKTADKLFSGPGQTALYLSLGYLIDQLVGVETAQGMSKDIRVSNVLASVKLRLVGHVPDGANRPEDFWNAWSLFALITGASKPQLSKSDPDDTQVAVVGVWSYPDLAILRTMVVRKDIAYGFVSTRHESFVRDALSKRIKGLKLIEERDRFKAQIVEDAERDALRGKSPEEVERFYQQRAYAEREKAIGAVKQTARSIIEKAKDAQLDGSEIRAMLEGMGAIDRAPRPAMDLDATVRSLTPSNAADLAERLIAIGDRRVVLAVFRRLKTFVVATSQKTAVVANN